MEPEPEPLEPKSFLMITRAIYMVSSLNHFCTTKISSIHYIKRWLERKKEKTNNFVTYRYTCRRNIHNIVTYFRRFHELILPVSEEIVLNGLDVSSLTKENIIQLIIKSWYKFNIYETKKAYHHHLQFSYYIYFVIFLLFLVSFEDIAFDK